MNDYKLLLREQFSAQIKASRNVRNSAVRTDTSTPSFEMMNDTGCTTNESPVGTKKLELEMMAFCLAERAETHAGGNGREAAHYIPRIQ